MYVTVFSDYILTQTKASHRLTRRKYKRNGFPI